MAENDGNAAVGPAGKSCFVAVRQVVGVDDQSLDSRIDQVIKAPRDERAVSHGNQRLGEPVGEWAESGAQAGPEHECGGDVLLQSGLLHLLHELHVVDVSDAIPLFELEDEVDHGAVRGFADALPVVRGV